MARMRTLKPGFFTNDSLAEIDPLGRLLFAGLWTIADREGRLENRPKKIKAELLPYDNCSVETLLTDLHSAGFLTLYEVQEKQFIQITNFLKHQCPNVKEPASMIPAPSKPVPVKPAEAAVSGEYDTGTVQAQCIPDTSTSLIGTEQNNTGTGTGTGAEQEQGVPCTPPLPAPSASVIFEEVFKQKPSIPLLELLAQIRDLEVWAEVCRVWRINNYSLRNMTGLIARYDDEVKRKSGGGRASPKNKQAIHDEAKELLGIK